MPPPCRTDVPMRRGHSKSRIGPKGRGATRRPVPADIQAGDWIEVGMLGAYGAAMKTRFNGFGMAEAVIVEDEPMVSLYSGTREDPRKSDNVVSLR